MVSFDVESLFTNIPTIETIEIILELAFKEGQKLYHGLTRDDLKKLLKICTQESHFQFGGKYFDQVDGVAMGSPLGPLFANVFMTNFERCHSDELKKLGVNQWLRYVDDIFATFSVRQSAERTLAFLNERHPNIKFTLEHESNNSLPFLDTRVYRRLASYHTTIYRKKTFTGVYLNWTSLTARRYKIDLIFCLLDRIWKVCSEPSERDIEISKLREILAKNDYPDQIIEQEIGRFLKNRSTPTEDTAENAQQPPPDPPPVEEKTKRYIVLPYVSQKVETFAKRLKDLVVKNYPQVDFNVAFRSPNEIGKLFPFKDNIKNVESRSLVVYRITCAKEGCDASYIGKTERILRHRIREHRIDKNSACHQHTQNNPGHEMAYDKVEVLDSADSNQKLLYKELLHIVHHKPTLNRQLNKQSEFNIKTLIIAAYPQVASEVATN